MRQPRPITPGHRANRREATRVILGLPMLASGGAVLAETSPPFRVGAALAVPAAELLDGGTFAAERAKGQVVVLYWWASWCPFCAAQTPEIQKLWDKHRGRGLTVLGISVDSRIEEARAYFGKKGYTFPSTFETPALARVLPRPGKGIPLTCVVGRDGRVVLIEQGQLFPEDIGQFARFI